MKTKKIFSLLTFVAIAVATYGQFAGDYKKNSIGIDLVPIVQNMVLSDEHLFPYGITYRHFIAPNHAVRLRGDFGYLNHSFDASGSIELSRRGLGMTVGYQYVLPLVKWADVLFILDAKYFFGQDKTQRIFPTVNEEISCEYWSVSVVPTIELQLKLTQHISIGLAILSPRYSYSRDNLLEVFFRTDGNIAIDEPAQNRTKKSHHTWGMQQNYVFLLYNF